MVGGHRLPHMTYTGEGIRQSRFQERTLPLKPVFREGYTPIYKDIFFEIVKTIIPLYILYIVVIMVKWYIEEEKP